MDNVCNRRLFSFPANSEICCRIYAFVAKHEDLCFYRDSCRCSLWGQISHEKGRCLSSKTREKNVCRGRMIDLSTEMARVAEVDRGILPWDEVGN